WSGPVERKREHFVDVAGTDRAHDQAVEAERHAGAFRQSVLQRREEVLVDRYQRQAAALALRHVALEASALLLRIAELVKSVAELDAVHVRLEARRDVSVHACQRGLRRGVVIDKGEAIEPELRTDQRAH